MKNSAVTLALTAELPGTRVAELTRDLQRDLAGAGVRTDPAAARRAPGDRGGAAAVGEIVLALVTSGAVKAVIDCLTAYLSRERTLAVRLTLANGRQLEVTARNVHAPEVAEALQSAAAVLGDKQQPS